MLAAHRFIPRSNTSIIVPTWFGSTSGNNKDTGGATSIASGANFTPNANTLVLVVANWFIAAVASTTTGISDTIGGLSWTEITGGWHTAGPFGTNAGKTSVFWAISGSSPPAGKVTITGASNGGHIPAMSFTVLQLPGANIASPIGNTNTNNVAGSSAGGGSSSTTVPLTATNSGAKLLFAALGIGGSNTPGTPTADAQYTSLFDYGFGGTNHTEVVAATNKAGVHSSTWALGAGSGNQTWFYDGILIEINE